MFMVVKLFHQILLLLQCQWLWIGTKVAEATSKLTLNSRQLAALEQADRIYADHRKGLIAKVIANSSMTEDQADKLEPAMLEMFANTLLPQPNYGGRVVTQAAATDDPVVLAMTPPSSLSVFRARQKANAAA